MNLKDIEKRQDAEKAFHDKKFASERKKDYYDLGFKSIITNRFMSKIGNIKNRKVLEFGCGNGWLTKILATKGAEVWTFDISSEAVKKTRSLIKSLDLQSRVHVDQMPAEELAYDSNMFDLIVGNAILHHLDLALCIKEIKRVLKDDGRAYFLEPLGHNPLLNLYRKMTPHLRSKDEMPMRFEQFSIIKDHFHKFEHEEYYLTAMLALFWHFFGMNSLMLKTRDLFFKLDRIIIDAFPHMGKYCWYSILEIEK